MLANIGGKIFHEKENQVQSEHALPSGTSVGRSGNDNNLSSPRPVLEQEQVLGTQEFISQKLSDMGEQRNSLTEGLPSLRVRQGMVLYTFEPENPGELAVEADEVIEVLEIKGEWVECITKDRRHGWVPFNYVQIQEKEVTI